MHTSVFCEKENILVSGLLPSYLVWKSGSCSHVKGWCCSCKQTQASDDIEKENSQLHQQLLELRSANTSLETEKHHVVEKLELFEHAHSNKTIATVPREELVELRAQVTLLAEMEKTIAGYERSEMNLKATISKLREGKVRVKTGISLINKNINISLYP